jgi:cytoskeletal protein RodZ
MRIGGAPFVAFGTRLLVLAALVIAGGVAWIMLPEPSGAQHDTVAVAPADAPPSEKPAPAQPATSSTVEAQPALIEQNSTEHATTGTAPASAPVVERDVTDGLKIASQSWRRGGLGSKALVTLTLRNANAFAVKDVEINCAFARADGTHLTDRKRVISDTINRKSRKTYSAMLIGFVNVNANKAKCSVGTASRN